MAIVNHGNDIQSIIEQHGVGRATTDRSQENLEWMANSLIVELSLQEREMSSRCKNLATKLFSSQVAVEQIVNALNSEK